MKTKCPLPKRFSGTKWFSGIILGVLAIALDASAAGAAPFAYISNAGSSSVSVIDGATNTVVCPPGGSPPCTSTVPVGIMPGGVAVNPAGTFAYVANKDDGTVTVIDTATNTESRRISVGQEPWGVAVSADGTRVYVALGNGNVAVIDGTTNNPLPNPISIPGAAALNGIAVAGSTVVVTDGSFGRVYVIDTATSVIKTVNLGLNSFPVGVAVRVDPTTGTLTRIYVSSLSSLSMGTLEVSVIDPALIGVPNVDPITHVPFAAGFSAGGIALSNDGQVLYVTDDSQNLYFVSTLSNAVTGSVQVGTSPYGVAVEPTNANRVYVGNTGDGTVSVVDVAAGTAVAVRVGDAPFAFGAFVTAGPTTPPPAQQYVLTTGVTGSGSVTPASGRHTAGSTVGCEAKAEPGWRFKKWEGACAGKGEGDCRVLMNSDKTVTAVFSASAPPPSACDAKIAELQKQVTSTKWKSPRAHNPWLKAALYARAAAWQELEKAKKKVPATDRKLQRALKEFKDGDAALCADANRRATHEYWGSFEISRSILRHHYDWRR
jgi:YVTN family beta-propeller protein